MSKHCVLKKLVVTVLVASLSFHFMPVSASFSCFYPPSGTSMYGSPFLQGSYSMGGGFGSGLDRLGSQVVFDLCKENVHKPLDALIARLIEEKVFFVSEDGHGVFWVFNDIKSLVETLIEIRIFVRLTEDLANSNSMFLGLCEGVFTKIKGAEKKIKKIIEDLEKKSLSKPTEDDIRMRKCKKFDLKDIME